MLQISDDRSQLSQCSVKVGSISMFRYLQNFPKASRPLQPHFLVPHARDLAIAVETTVRTTVSVYVLPRVSNNLSISWNAAGLQKNAVTPVNVEFVVSYRARALPLHHQYQVWKEIKRLAAPKHAGGTDVRLNDSWS